MSQVAKKYHDDEVFREVANLLLGDGSDLISKMNPVGSDLAVKTAERKKKNSEKTQARIGLASNVVGLAAGVAGTKDAYEGFRAARDPAANYRGKHTKIEGPKHRIPKMPGRLKPSTKALAAGALGLQVGNIAGDAVANRVLARAAKKDDKKKDIHKSIAEIEEQASKVPNKGKLTRAAITSPHAGKGVQKIKGGFKRLPNKTQTINKNQDILDVVWEGEIAKMDSDKRQVFGWASIVELNGEKVVDLQGDYISIDEVEKSAYDYVHKSRKGGDMHLRDQMDGEDRVVHKSDMIESFVITPEKKKALKMPEDTPTGWWVGYQINDDELWQKVKSGERTGFSIHGRGVRS